MASTTPHGQAIAQLAAELNERIDCNDLADKLGLERPASAGGRGNYRSPHHADKSPSVGIYADKRTGRSRWMDYSTDEGGGPVDLVIYVRGCDFITALRELCDLYGYKMPSKADSPAAPARELTRAEFIAEKCAQAVRSDDVRAELLTYLEGRGIARSVIERAIARGALACNTYTNPKAKPGEVGYGGLAAAFLVRAQLGGQVMAVDMRYMAPDLNGGVKTQSQGEKSGYPWTSDWRRVETAKTIYVVESSINALTVETCNLPDSAAVSVRGTGNVENIDWSFCRGKQVIAVFDNDKPQEHGPKKGYCPGLMAAWRLHELLTGLDIICIMVDQADWWHDGEGKDADKGEPINDLNDYLQARGVDATTKALGKLEAWMIPGMPGDDSGQGRSRLWLPAHDFAAYWRYRVAPDFTKVIGKVTRDDDGNEKLEFQDVCGFRVAGVSRVQIASPTSTMTGDTDHSPHTVFALSVQVPRHSKLIRRVVDDERLHNIEVWKKLGPVFAPTPFARMINVWERAANIGARDAINFVGLAWRDGKAVVNEGPDCFFADPRQQCPYHELIFPSGTVSDGRRLLELFRATFADNAALRLLVWGLGAHLKAFLGFWPHMVVQAEKGTGKTTLIKRLERALAMVMSSRQSLQTEFRQLTSLSYTSHPVGWGEMSTNKQDVITKAIANLQEAYQYEHTRRGAELMDFLVCAPVLLAGEDVPVQSLIGKTVRTELTKSRQGPLIPEDIPAFPVKQWLNFLTTLDKAAVRSLHQTSVNDMFERCVATTADAGAERMVNNYAALATAWELLCQYLDVSTQTGGFVSSLTAEMNAHIGETTSDRQPWAWIVDKLLGEIASGKFFYPFKFDDEDEVPVLCVRTSHVMAHMSQTPYLREFWDGLPVKSDRVFKKQLDAAGVLATDTNGTPLSVERTIKGARVPHMVALSLPMLREFGLHAVVPERSEN